MAKLLLLIVLALVVWQLVRKALAPPASGSSGEPAQFEPTGRCAKCGTHVPRAQLDGDGVCARCRAA